MARQELIHFYSDVKVKNKNVSDYLSIKKTQFSNAPKYLRGFYWTDMSIHSVPGGDGVEYPAGVYATLVPFYELPTGEIIGNTTDSFPNLKNIFSVSEDTFTIYVNGEAYGGFTLDNIGEQNEIDLKYGDWDRLPFNENDITFCDFPNFIICDSQPDVGIVAELPSDKYNAYTGGLNSQALSDNSFALGSNTLAGVKGFYWTAVCRMGPYEQDDYPYHYYFTITIDYASMAPTTLTPSVAQQYFLSFTSGDKFTVHGGSKYDKRFVFQGVGDFSSVIEGSTLCLLSKDELNLTNEYSPNMDFSDNAIFCPEKPIYGKVDFGKYAFAAGEVSKATNYGATAFGRKNEAYGQYATAFGRENIVGYAGFAAGRNNTVSGESAAALNQGNTASGNWSFAGGYKSQATNSSAIAYGQMTKATGLYSAAFGEQTEAKGAGTITAGRNTKAEGEASQAFGRNTIAKSAFQFVAGKYNVEDNTETYAQIIGGGHADDNRLNIHTVDWYGNAWYAGDVQANGSSLKTAAKEANSALNKIGMWYSDPSLKDEGGVLGLGAHQTARYGAALGWGCQATGDHGMAFGTYALAKGGQMALGKANDPEADYLVNNNLTPLLMVGNGEVNGSGAYLRSNAFVVTKDGKGFLGGKKILTEGGNTGIPADITAESLTLRENEYETVLITPSEFCLQNSRSIGQMRLGLTSGLYINTGSGYCPTAAISITSVDSNYRQHTITLDPVNARIAVDDTPVLVDNTEQMYDITLSGYTSDMNGKTWVFSISATIISSLNLDITKDNLNTLLKNASNVNDSTVYGTGVMTQTAESGAVTILNGFSAILGQDSSLYLSSVNRGSIYVDLNNTDVTLTGSKYRIIV